MKKDRIPVPENVATELMFCSDRTCCVCRERGKPIQIHHIDEDPSNNDPSNLAILCLHCHDDTQSTGGFGRKLSDAQVTYYRNDWHRRVEARRREADEIALTQTSGSTLGMARSSTRRDALPDPVKLLNYISTLPAVRKDIYGRTREKWDSGKTPQMRRGSYDVIDVLEQILHTLESWYQPGHFGGQEAKNYINEVTASRFSWHRAHLEPNGHGAEGTMIRTMVAGCVIHDLEGMVVDMVGSLGGHLDEFDFAQWEREWTSAHESVLNGQGAFNPCSSEGGAGESVPIDEYARRILGRWLGPRKYASFFADGRWGVQRNEDAPIEINGRRWWIEGNRLFLTFQEDAGKVSSSESIITSFTTMQFITEDNGYKRTYDWAP